MAWLCKVVVSAEASKPHSGTGRLGSRSSDQSSGVLDPLLTGLCLNVKSLCACRSPVVADYSTVKVLVIVIYSKSYARNFVRGETGAELTAKSTK